MLCFECSRRFHEKTMQIWNAIAQKCDPEAKCSNNVLHVWPSVSRGATNGSWQLRNEHQTSILMTRHYPDLASDESSVWNFCARLLKYRLLNASKFMSSQRTIFCHCCIVFFCLFVFLFTLRGSVIHAIFLLKYFMYWLCLVSWPLQCNILCNTGFAWSGPNCP